MPKWLRRVIVAMLIVGALLVLADGIVGRIFRAKMAAALEKMGITLECSSAWYIPPVGVSLHHVRLVRTTEEGSRIEMLNASRVSLKLASIPKKGHPPEIKRFSIRGGKFSYTAADEDPIVVGELELQIAPVGTAANSYRVTLHANPNQPDQVEGSAAVDVSSGTVAVTNLQLHAKFGALVRVISVPPDLRRKLEKATSDGTVDIHASATAPSHDWRQAAIHGGIQLHAARLHVPHSQVYLDDANADIHVEPTAGTGLQITCRTLKAAIGKTLFEIDGGEFTTHFDGSGWNLNALKGRLDVGGGVAALDKVQLRGRFVFTGGADGPAHIPRNATALSVVRHELIVYPRDASIQPHMFPIAVEHITGGPITFHGGVVRFANLMGEYGGDRLLLDTAHITLDDPRQKIEISDLRKQVKIDGISGTLVCRQPGPLYPAKLGLVIEQLRPTGSFAIGGGSWYAINRKLPGEVAKPKGDYFFHIATTTGSFALTDHKVPLKNIHGDATVSPMLVNITELRGDCVGGTVVATGKITPIRPVLYEGIATFYNANLGQLSRQLDLKLKKPLVGVAYLQAHVSGYGKGGKLSPIDSFAANGELEVVQGNFGDISVIRQAAQPVTKPDQSFDGQAAGSFEIRHEVVTLDNCVVGNSAFGLQGSGTIGFNKQLDLHAVAAPLGDWSIALKKSRVPIVDGVGSDIAGGIQALFSGAQRALLYDVNITGATDHPTVTVTPAPAITEPLAALFGQMINPGKDSHLIDRVRSKKQ